MTTREIVAAFKELYGAEVSATLIAKVTDAVITQVIEYPKGIKAIYLALGVNMDGRKELPGLYPAGIKGCQKTKALNFTHWP